MKHHVKTKKGISKEYIQQNKDTILEENGQGNAASVPGWHGHNEILNTIYKQIVGGNDIRNPDNTVAFQQWILSFVDDNKMLMLYENDIKVNKIIHLCKESLQTWETLLNITGGALELSKCLITIMQYNFETSYKNNFPWSRPGIPKLNINNGHKKNAI